MLTSEDIELARIQSRQDRQKAREGCNLPAELKPLFLRERDAKHAEQAAIASKAMEERRRIENQQTAELDQLGAQIKSASNEVVEAAKLLADARHNLNRLQVKADFRKLDFQARITRQTRIIAGAVDRKLLADFLDELSDIAGETRGQFQTQSRHSGQRSRRTGHPLTEAWTNGQAIDAKLAAIQQARAEMTRYLEGMEFLPYDGLLQRMAYIRTRLGRMSLERVSPAYPGPVEESKPTILERIFGKDS